MKQLILLLSFIFSFAFSFSQETPKDSTSQKELHIVTKNDGTQFIGIILKNDAREVLIKTEDKGEIYIPKHEIKSITKIEASNFKTGKYVGENPLASRYILTTNGIPLKKKESYLKVSFPLIFDFEIGITDRLSAGVMSSIYGMPLVANVKYSFDLSERVKASAGVIYGNATWLSSMFYDGKPFRLGGGIAYGNLTFGDSKKNLNFSGGYGFVHYLERNYVYNQYYYYYSNYTYTPAISGTGLFSVAGMNHISTKATLLFDSVIAYKDGDIFYVFAPAVRYINKTNIWQFGVSMMGLNEDVVPIPLPLVSYHKKL